MIVTDEIMKLVETWGGYNIPAYRMAILLKMNKADRELFLFHFDDPDSDIRMAWERGRTLSEIDIMQSLDNFAKADQEGSGEAAKALGAIKQRQTINQLKKDLFGL